MKPVERRGERREGEGDVASDKSLSISLFSDHFL